MASQQTRSGHAQHCQQPTAQLRSCQAPRLPAPSWRQAAAAALTSSRDTALGLTMSPRTCRQGRGVGRVIRLVGLASGSLACRAVPSTRGNTQAHCNLQPATSTDRAQPAGVRHRRMKRIHQQCISNAQCAAHSSPAQCPCRSSALYSASAQTAAAPPSPACARQPGSRHASQPGAHSNKGPPACTLAIDVCGSSTTCVSTRQPAHSLLVLFECGEQDQRQLTLRHKVLKGVGALEHRQHKHGAAWQSGGGQERWDGGGGRGKIRQRLAGAAAAYTASCQPRSSRAAAAQRARASTVRHEQCAKLAPIPIRLHVL